MFPKQRFYKIFQLVVSIVNTSSVNLHKNKEHVTFISMYFIEKKNHKLHHLS